MFGLFVYSGARVPKIDLKRLFNTYLSNYYSSHVYGGTKTLFRNLPTGSNFGKTPRPSCSEPKIEPKHKI